MNSISFRRSQYAEDLFSCQMHYKNGAYLFDPACMPTQTILNALFIKKLTQILVRYLRH